MRELAPRASAARPGRRRPVHSGRRRRLGASAPFVLAVLLGCSHAEQPTVHAAEPSASSTAAEPAAALPTLERLRTIRDHAIHSRSEEFKALAEPLLHTPADLEPVMELARSGELDEESELALADFLGLALVSYSAARTNGYYGPDFDPEPFVDQVVMTMPALSPVLAAGLLQRINEYGLLTPEHAWMCTALTGIEETRMEAWKGLVALYRERLVDERPLLDFASSRGGDELERALRAEVWCALIEREPSDHLPLVRGWMDGGRLQEDEVLRLVDCVSSFADAVGGFAILRDVAEDAQAIDTLAMQLFQKVDRPIQVELAKQSYVESDNPFARSLYLASVRSDGEFLERALEGDSDVCPAAWAGFFLFHLRQETGERIGVVRSVAERLTRSEPDFQARQAIDRLLVLFDELSGVPDAPEDERAVELARFVRERVAQRPDLKQAQRSSLLKFCERLESPRSLPAAPAEASVVGEGGG